MPFLIFHYNIGNMFLTDDRGHIESFNLKKIIPNSMQYITYDGSLTYPGCFETVTWVLINKPIYLGVNQVRAHIIFNSTNQGW